MMPRDSLSEEVIAFAAALKHVYDGQSWESVAPFAQRAWEKIEHIAGEDWANVNGAIQQAWSPHAGFE